MKPAYTISPVDYPSTFHDGLHFRYSEEPCVALDDEPDGLPDGWTIDADGIITRRD